MASSPPLEVELKLLLDESALESLRVHEGLARRATGRARLRRLHSVYYDTPDLRLYGEGIALRVRRVGSEYVQTVKATASDDAGLFARVEIENELPSFEPSLDSVSDEAMRERLIDTVGASPLEALCETDFKRTTLRLREAGSEIDADLDVGEIRTPAGVLPICELELELKRGDAGALYVVAQELAEKVSFRVGMRSKFERGVAQVRGESPAPVKAKACQVDPEESLEAALERALQECARHLLGNEDPAYIGTDPRGLRELERGLRRLRSALVLFAETLPAATALHLEEELAWLAEPLAAAREVDAFNREVLEPLLDRAGGGSSLEWLRREGRELALRRYEAVRALLDSQRYATFVLDLTSFIACRGWREQQLSVEAAALFQPARDYLRAALEQAWQELAELDDEMDPTDEAGRHAARRSVERLQHCTQFFGSAFSPKASRRLCRRCAKVARRLAHVEQLMSTRVHLDERIGSLAQARPELRSAHERGAGFVTGWAAHEVGPAARRAHKALKKLQGGKPFWR